MDEITFSYATTVRFGDAGTPWPVGECSRCGALVRDAGTTTERHTRWHQELEFPQRFVAGQS